MVKSMVNLDARGTSSAALCPREALQLIHESPTSFHFSCEFSLGISILGTPEPKKHGSYKMTVCT